METTFKANKLQLLGISELHPDGYRRTFNNVVQAPAEGAVEQFSRALGSLTDESITEGTFTTANTISWAA